MASNGTDTEMADSEDDETLLYHYTTQKGLLGIIRDRAIFATDCRFVNDEQELLYGFDAIDMWRFKKGEEPQTEFVAPHVHPFPGAKALPVRDIAAASPYIACLSKKGDQLSQWRGYGLNEGAVALGFLRADLEQTLGPANSPRTVHLDEVFYKPSKQRELFEDTLGKGNVFNPLSPGAGRTSAAKITAAAIRCKHRGFAEEKEWRVWVPRGGPEPFSVSKPDCFRVQGKHLVPYINVRLCSEGEKTIPFLRRVICAPGDPGGIARTAVRSMLDAAGYKNVRVKRSKIPYRG